MTRYEAAYHFRKAKNLAFARYRDATNAACRAAGPGYMLSETCKNEMCDAWTMLKSDLAFASRQMNERAK